jgi:pantoate kinase
MTKASAFCPAGISSFFQAVTTSPPPRSIGAACRIGARGGGFVIDKGVTTEVKITSTKKTGIAVTINGKNAPEANVTREVFKLILSKIKKPYQISVSHHVEVPIGAGYGASAAGAVSTAMALAKAFDLKMTLNQIAQIAHTAEIRCATGLGSVSGVIRGGAILILDPGAPGYDRVDWLPMNPTHRIVTASFAPISKKDIIFAKDALQAVNREGQMVLRQILTNPDPVRFMNLCRGFAEKAGFLSNRLAEVIENTMGAGALGATQNMIGDAFHALVDVKKVDSVVSSIADYFESEVLVSKISKGGPIYT